MFNMENLSMAQKFRFLDTEGRLKETFAIVEANMFERGVLWEKYNKEYKWEDVSDGVMPTVGFIHKRPIVISLFWSIINDHPVLFYYTTSQVVDYVKIEDQLKEWLPQVFKDQPRLKKDASNFYHILSAIKDSK